MGVFLTYVAPPQAIVINHDAGGIVQQYEDMAALYTREGRRIEIRGLCSSACTLALTIPSTCVGKNAKVAWHQAYTTDTHEPRPEVTERMLSGLPARLKAYLSGKVKVDYTPETILYHDQLVSLGVPSCDEPAYKAPSATANVTYSTPVSKPLTSSSAPATSRLTTETLPPEDKTQEWHSYVRWAVGQSKAQFGSAVTAKYCFKNGECSFTVYYYDGRHQYVSAIEYVKAGKTLDRQVCRSASEYSTTMMCTDWDDNSVTKYVHNSATGQYVEAK